MSLPRIITCAVYKGGAGKTTTAVFLAEALAGLRPVRLIDLDTAQGSAADWYEEAVESGSPMRVRDVRRADRFTDALLEALDPAAVVVIDTPNEPAAAEPAIRAADLVIVPTTPGLLDVGRVWPTLDLTADHEIAARVLLNRVLPRHRRADRLPRMLATLTENGADPFQTVIRSEGRTENARGRSVTDYQLRPYLALLSEIAGEELA